MNRDLKVLLTVLTLMVATAMAVNKAYGETKYSKAMNTLDEIKAHTSLRAEDLVKDHLTLRETEEWFESQPETIKMHKDMDPRDPIEQAALTTQMKILMAKGNEINRRHRALDILAVVVEPVLETVNWRSLINL